jgi:rhodanese-related sulfurtransferase
MSLTVANGSVRWVGLRRGRGVVVCRSGNSRQADVQTLEQLDLVYDQPYPPFASRRKEAVARKGDAIAIGE